MAALPAVQTSMVFGYYKTVYHKLIEKGNEKRGVEKIVENRHKLFTGAFLT